jgi:hypothetical protein
MLFVDAQILVKEVKLGTIIHYCDPRGPPGPFPRTSSRAMDPRFRTYGLEQWFQNFSVFILVLREPENNDFYWDWWVT